MRPRNRTRAIGTGQALVEAALVLPALLGLVLCIFAFGHAYGSYLVVVGASRDGARLAAIGRPAEEVLGAVGATLASAGLQADASVSVSGGATAGDPVAVDVRAWLAFPVPVPGLPDPLPLAARSVMRRE